MDKCYLEICVASHSIITTYAYQTDSADYDSDSFSDSDTDSNCDSDSSVNQSCRMLD